MASSSLFNLFQIDCDLLKKFFCHWLKFCKFGNKLKLVCDLRFFQVVVADNSCKRSNCIRVKSDPDEYPNNVKDSLYVGYGFYISITNSTDSCDSPVESCNV